MIRGCIFDGDGTVIDSMSIWVNAGVRYLTRHGIHFPASLPEELGPLGLNDTIHLLKDRFAIPLSEDKIFQDVWADITNFYRNEAPCKPGMKDLLSELKRRGIPMVLATAGDLSLLEPAMRREGIFTCFDHRISCKEYHTDKDHSLIYEKGAELMGLAPTEVAVFEDAHYALGSAAEAGCYTVRVSEPAFASKDFPPVDLWVEDFTDMTNFYARLPG